MSNEKYLSEEKYQETNKKVKKVAKVLLIIGLVLLVIGFVLGILEMMKFGNGFFSFVGDEAIDAKTLKESENNILDSFGLFAASGFMEMIGFSLTGVGAMVMFFAHRREIMAYTTQQVMPVAQEGVEKISPTVANAAGNIAKSVSKGIYEGRNEARVEDKDK